MEPPVSWSAKAIHDEKVKVLQATNRMEGDAVDICSVRGQYGPGMIGERADTARSQEWRPTPIPKPSRPSSSASIRGGGPHTPIYLRTGKRLPTRMTEVVLTFKNTPQMLFQRASRRRPSRCSDHAYPARRRRHADLKRQDSWTGLPYSSSSPGFLLRFDLQRSRSRGLRAPASRRHAWRSDAFTRTDEVEEGWSIIQGILDKWAITPATFPNYAAGDWGPECADDILHAPEHSWRNP